MVTRWSAKLSVTTLLFLFTLSLSGLLTQPKVAQAANGDTTSIRLLDTDVNGSIESIDVYIDNPTAETWAVQSAGGSSGFTVTQNGDDITIDGVALTTGPTENPIIVRITLDEADPDFVVTTDGTAENEIELIYTQDGAPGACTECVSDGTTELNAIASGDTDTPADTEDDYADPVFLSGVYEDQDHDGQIDSVVITTSEDITACDFDAGDWEFTVDGSALNLGGISAVDCLGVFDYLTVTVVGAEGVTGSDLAPELTYTNNANNVTGSAIGVGAVATVSLTLSDNAAPVVFAAEYIDEDDDAMIDHVYANVSNEDVMTFNFDEDSWTVNDAGTINLGDETFASLETDEVLGDYISFVVSADADITGGATDPIMHFTSSLDSELTDAASNHYSDYNFTVTDGAGPVLLSAEYQDQDGDGKVDGAVVTASEEIGTCLYVDGDWSYSEAGTIELADETGITCDGSTITLASNGADGMTGGATDPVLDYTGDNLEDATGNAAATASLTVADAAAPVVKSLGYAENNEGKISSVTLSFTESIVAGSTLAENNLVFDNVGDFTGMAFGSSSTDVVTSTVTSVAFGLGTPATVIDTHDDSGNLAFSLSGTFSLLDAVGNNNTTTGSQTQAEILDIAGPRIATCGYYDSFSIGFIDRIICEFSESVTGSSTVASNQFTFTNVGDFTGMAFGSSSTDVVTSTVTSVEFDLGTPATVIDTHDDSGDLAISLGSLFRLFDSQGNGYTGDGEINVPWTDEAGPVIFSSSPEDGETGVSSGANITVVFSELLDEPGLIYATHWTITEDEVELDQLVDNLNYVVTDDTDVNRTEINFTHDRFGHRKEIALFIQNGPDHYLDLAGNALESSQEIVFTTRSSGGGSSSGSTSSGGTSSTAAAVDLTAPVSGDEFEAEDTTKITWTTSGSGADTVKLEYSTDGGSTWTKIADNVDKEDESYDWMIPDVSSDEMVIKISLQDSGKATLDTDTSSTFTILKASTSTPTTDAEDGITTDDAGRRWAPGSGEDGVSPYDGSTEEISTVESGWYVRGEHYAAVYYVSSDSVRRVFWDTQTFFTWADSWDDVIWVTDATLATMELGDPMLPKAGVTLVKIQSDAKTYATEMDGSQAVLRWIVDEDTAVALYGSDWADYVIDIDPTIMSHYSEGETMTSADEVDTSDMRTRQEIAEMAS